MEGTEKMKWVLVIVWVVGGSPNVVSVEQYESMYDCFYGFEQYEDKLIQEEMQLVCIREIEHE